MSNFLTSFLFSLGVGAWVYNKVMRRNGGLAQQALIAAGVCGVVVMIIFYTLIVAVSNYFK